MAHIIAELLQAFSETHYIVHHETPFAMHIGRPCPELKALMANHNALSAAFITAWNPFSQNHPAKENTARQDELKANLKRRGLICIDGIGKHSSNNWPGEVSVLVLGLDLEAAKSLARHYEQHAFVWAEGDGSPQLMEPWNHLIKPSKIKEVGSPDEPAKITFASDSCPAVCPRWY